MYKFMCRDILTEKSKIGGNWVIADAIPTRKMRDLVKQECNATFIVLNMSEELQRKRVTDRHSDGNETQMIDWLTSLFRYYEPVQEDEKDAFELFITPEMGIENVVDKVGDLINQLN